MFKSSQLEFELERIWAIDETNIRFNEVENEGEIYYMINVNDELSYAYVDERDRDYDAELLEWMIFHYRKRYKKYMERL